ncbi:MAG: hypothetical protein HXY37_06945 [Chloroflexi bacterium]|nr:hypothetical protein [Chloroflexota bacterium]
MRITLDIPDQPLKEHAGHQAEDMRVLLCLMDHVPRLTPERASEARQAMRQVEEEIFIGGISVCIWYEPGS